MSGAKRIIFAMARSWRTRDKKAKALELATLVIAITIFVLMAVLLYTMVLKKLG